ncbi:MAG: dihydrolipoyl dehydrogenase [Ruthenibacterium sp.]
MNTFNLCVIGAGPGGYIAALEAAKCGKKVALCESRDVGGTCLNRGCIPTKALLRAANVYHEAAVGDALGIHAQNISYNMADMHTRVDAVTATLRGGIAQMLAKAKVEIICGTATITAPHTVSVNGETLTADAILIATGSSPAAPPISGIDLPGVVNSDAFLTHGGIDCKKLVIIGGGVVGVEFAQIYNDLGCTVTILEAMPRLLPPLEKEFAQNLSMIFKKRGITVCTGAKVREIVQSNEGLCCRYTEKDADAAVFADCVLVCTGRTPNTKNLCADTIDLKPQRGYLPVDAHYETAVKDIYAIGDVVLGGIQLAHAAEAAARNFVRFLYGDASVKNTELIPSCVFTQPEIASVGLSADEAKAQNIAVTTRKSLTSANGKALVEGADRGFVKLVFDAESHKLRGAQLMCPHASEMIGALAAAIGAGMTQQSLDATVFPHPTVSETILG